MLPIMSPTFLLITSFSLDQSPSTPCQAHPSPPSTPCQAHASSRSTGRHLYSNTKMFIQAHVIFSIHAFLRGPSAKDMNFIFKLLSLVFTSCFFLSGTVTSSSFIFIIFFS
ncbi:hypothetical protein AMECASPLE_028335 [Ameca splendens]|uniref:Uncharacterized protein n=1 Tax=Ameca splendens TaxID=208324 RepID=A0ABV0ZEA4_9TELE